MKAWLLGENQSLRLYNQGFRRGGSGNYQLIGRNLSLFGNQPMTGITKPFSKLSSFGKGISNFGTGLAVAGAVVDTYEYSNGTLSGARYSYHLTGIGASTAALYFAGGPFGAAVGASFVASEMAWDLTQPLRQKAWNSYWQFRTGLNNNWRPR